MLICLYLEESLVALKREQEGWTMKQQYQQQHSQQQNA